MREISVHSQMYEEFIYFEDTKSFYFILTVEQKKNYFEAFAALFFFKVSA